MSAVKETLTNVVIFYALCLRLSSFRVNVHLHLQPDPRSCKGGESVTSNSVLISNEIS